MRMISRCLRRLEKRGIGSERRQVDELESKLLKFRKLNFQITS